MSLTTTLSLKHCIRSNRDGSVATDGNPLQFVELRFWRSSKLMSPSPHQIIQQTAPTLISDALFHFPLSELEGPPFLSRYFLHRFLSSFNLPPAASDAIFDNVASFALQLAGGNLDLNFHIIADVDLLYTFWVEADLGQESAAATKGAPTAVIERLTKEKYDGNGGEEEMGEKCSICYEDLHGETEVRTRIPCGHVYHQSCIIKWVSINNSCPLCRKELQE